MNAPTHREDGENRLVIGLHLVTRDGATIRISGTIGDSLMETITESGEGDLAAVCGGCCSCGTCHVYIQDQYMPKLEATNSCEREMLDCSGHRQSNSRLSCQIRLTKELDGMKVVVAPED